MLTRTSRVKVVVAPLVAAAVGWQALASFVWVAPQTPLEDSIGPVLTAHFAPVFAQSWTIFAPLPYQGDMKVEAEYSDGTDVDLTALLREQGVHHPAPPRSWRMLESFARDLADAHAALDQAGNAAVAVDVTDPAAPLPDLGDYSVKEAAMVRLVSTYRCAESPAPSSPLLLRLRVTFQGVVPYGATEAPAPVTSVITGWRPTVPVSDDECASAPWPR